jgi:hypothetical protein
LRGLFGQFGAVGAARAAAATEAANDQDLPGAVIALKQSALRSLARFESIRDGVPLSSLGR